MRYWVAILDYQFAEDWRRDVFEQALADIGFDSFDGEKAYIPEGLLDAEALRAIVDETEGVELRSLEACEDRNWNEVWESEHPMMELPLGVRIKPRCAFGAGYHETTGMIIDRIVETQKPKDKSVLDNGCGTGILGIMAARVGAKEVTMVDIDEKSVANSLENIALNTDRCAARSEIDGTKFTVVQGDVPVKGTYDLILSNIHRNILLQQMPLYKAYLNKGGEVWLSGFYESDCAVLLEAAAKEGLQLKDREKRGDWMLLVLNGND